MAMRGERRLLLSAYSGQTLPLAPYSVADLLQYFRSYWLKVAVDKRLKGDVVAPARK